MSEVWLDPEQLLDVLQQPWKHALTWVSGWGGAMFLGSTVALAAMMYVWWHTKEVIAAGLAGMLVGMVLYIVPELRLAAYVALALGAGTVIWKFLREVV